MSPSLTVLYDRPRPEERLIAGALERLGVRCQLLHAPSFNFELGAPAPAVVLQRCVSQWRGVSLARAFEAAGATVINSSAVIATCGDKLATSAALQRAGVPTPRTSVALSIDAALTAAQSLGYPVVTKPLIGSWGRLVARAEEPESLRSLLEARELLGGPEHKIHYLQEYIDKPGRDIRAFVIGEEVVCAIYRTSAHWITNTARGAAATNCPLSVELTELALRAANAVGGGILAVDLMESERGLLVTEVNHTVEFRNSTEPTGVDIPLSIARFAANHLPVNA